MIFLIIMLIFFIFLYLDDCEKRLQALEKRLEQRGEDSP